MSVLKKNPIDQGWFSTEIFTQHEIHNSKTVYISHTSFSYTPVYMRSLKKIFHLSLFKDHFKYGYIYHRVIYEIVNNYVTSNPHDNASSLRVSHRVFCFVPLNHCLSALYRIDFSSLVIIWLWLFRTSSALFEIPHPKFRKLIEK